MTEYTFIAIHTLVDLGDGVSGLFDESGSITPTANLARMVDNIMRYTYPFVTRVEVDTVDLSTTKNQSYYKLTNWTGNQTIYTFKFTVHSIDVDKLRNDLNNIPLVIPTIVDDKIIRRFITSGAERNTTIITNTFA